MGSLVFCGGLCHTAPPKFFCLHVTTTKNQSRKSVTGGRLWSTKSRYRKTLQATPSAPWQVSAAISSAGRCDQFDRWMSRPIGRLPGAARGASSICVSVALCCPAEHPEVPPRAPCIAFLAPTGHRHGNIEAQAGSRRSALVGANRWFCPAWHLLALFWQLGQPAKTGHQPRLGDA